jgi:flagellar protein FlaG
MDVSPILPAAAAAALPTPTPPAPAEAVVTVAATTGSAKGASTDSATSEQQKDGSQASVDKALKEINDQMAAWSTQLQFSIDPDLHRVVVSIVDSKTGKTISTIPSEAMLRIAKMITKLEGKSIQTSV